MSHEPRHNTEGNVVKLWNLLKVQTIFTWVSWLESYLRKVSDNGRYREIADNQSQCYPAGPPLYSVTDLYVSYNEVFTTPGSYN